jgi:chitin disaccharide deacetylase
VLLGRIRAADVEVELRAQYDRFLALVGHVPRVVNSHQHTAIFPPIGDILLQVLSAQRPLPYLRRVREPWSMLARIPGAKIKRTLLTVLGRRHARAQHRLGFPGPDWLAGITDPPCIADPDFLARWLARVPGEVVELTCHPGYTDQTLIGRDCTPEDGQLQRRVRELSMLRHVSFRKACHRAGFRLVSPTELLEQRVFGNAHAA